MQNLPIIDQAQLTGVSELTKELFTLLAQQLPEAKLSIHEALANSDLDKANGELHRLQGSCAYCGLKRLNPIIIKFQEELKKNPSDYSSLLQNFDQEVDSIMSELRRLGFC